MEYLARTGVSEQRRLREWNADYPYRCRTSCPGAELLPADMDRNVSITPPSSPAIDPGPLQVLRSCSRPSGSAQPVELTTTPLPLIIDVDAMDQTPSLLPIVQPTTPTVPLPPFAMPEHPALFTHSYVSDSPPNFTDFNDFEQYLQRDPSTIDDCFRVSGHTVEEAAHALISAIKSSRQNPQARFHPSTQVRGGEGQILLLSNVLLYRTWLFDA